MPDLYMTDTGDLTISSTGDLALTDTNWRDFSQQAYMIMMTPITDYALYPALGTELESLIGMPQTERTGQYGCELIKAALAKNNKFINTQVSVKAIPTGIQSIRFDIYITIGNRSEMILSIEQELGII